MGKKSERKVLMGCTHYLTSPCQVGSQHLAREFDQAGYQVAYLSAPITPLHLFKGIDTDVKTRYTLFKKGGKHCAGGKVRSFVPGALLSPNPHPFFRSILLYNTWFHLTVPNLLKTLDREGFLHPDILYIDNLTYCFLARTIHFKKSVFRLVDNPEAYPNPRGTAFHLLVDIAQRVDLVSYTASSLEQYVQRIQPRKMFYLPNGVDYDRLSSFHGEPPDEYRFIPCPRAVYVGVMDSRFDFTLVKEIARLNPSVSFVLIGPSSHAHKNIRNLSNIYLLGEKDFPSIPGYLHYADVGIIPFRTSETDILVHYTHPLKLYQYMACGLPVVSTRWMEIERMESPAVLCSNADEFSKAISHFINHGYDKAISQNYAARAGWNYRMSSLLQALGEE